MQFAPGLREGIAHKARLRRGMVCASSCPSSRRGKCAAAGAPGPTDHSGHGRVVRRTPRGGKSGPLFPGRQRSMPPGLRARRECNDGDALVVSAEPRAGRTDQIVDRAPRRGVVGGQSARRFRAGSGSASRCGQADERIMLAEAMAPSVIYLDAERPTHRSARAGWR